MLNTQGGGSKYTKYTVFLACEQIHSKYTAKYTVSGGGGWQTRESHACTNGQVPIRNTKKLNLEHLECSYQPHIQGQGAKKRTQRAG